MILCEPGKGDGQVKVTFAGGRWFNDDDADDYQENEFAGSDSILALTTPV